MTKRQLLKLSPDLLPALLAPLVIEPGVGHPSSFTCRHCHQTWGQAEEETHVQGCIVRRAQQELRLAEQPAQAPVFRHQRFPGHCAQVMYWGEGLPGSRIVLLQEFRAGETTRMLTQMSEEHFLSTYLVTLTGP